MNYLSTIAWHGLNIMTFRHKGEGLEDVSKNNVLTIAALSTLITTVALVAEGNSFKEILVDLLVYVAFFALFYKTWPIQRVAGIFCLFFVFAFVRVLNASVFYDWVAPQNMVFIMWECIAMMVYITRAK
jgi:hypothetical protein